MSVAKTVIEGQEHSIARIRAGTLSGFWFIQLHTKKHEYFKALHLVQTQDNARTFLYLTWTN
jgi:hypothetical protein